MARRVVQGDRRGGQAVILDATQTDLEPLDPGTHQRDEDLVEEGKGGLASREEGDNAAVSRVAAQRSPLQVDEAKQVARAYLPDGASSVLGEIVGEQVAEIHLAMSRAFGVSGEAAQLDQVIEHDARRLVFRLEALLRLCVKIDPVFEVAEALVDQLEDRIGRVTELQSARAWAAAKGVPAEVLATYDQEIAARRAVVWDILNGRGEPAHPSSPALAWRADESGRIPALVALVEASQAAQLGGDAHALKELQGVLCSAVAKAASAKPVLKTLEEMHKGRRRFRWLVLYTEALGGLVQVAWGKNPIREMDALVGDPAARKKYQLNPSPPHREHVKAVHVPEGVMMALGKVIFELGEIKDAGEAEKFLAWAYEHTPGAIAPAGLLRSHEEIDAEVFKRAKKVHAAFTKLGALDLLLSCVKKGMRPS